MDRQTWAIAGIITAVVLVIAGVVTIVGTNRQLSLQKAALADSAEALKRSRAELERAESEASLLKEKLEQAGGRISELQQANDQAALSRRSLEDEMRATLESKDVTISKLQGKLTVNILDRVLFDSGEAYLKPDGESVLRKVAGFLTQHPTLKVHVIGHTDNIPIKPSARSRYPSNWELSLARAGAAVRFLSEQAGVDPHRLGALGYGEFRPIADNSTAEGRARNRRIAITVLSEELAGADSNVAPATNAQSVFAVPKKSEPPKD
ncbi:MAG: hypothetical protein RLY20_1739 [Verrucomicrobiota bacterium]|jgi:chemotaxis protein MotB